MEPQMLNKVSSLKIMSLIYLPNSRVTAMKKKKIKITNSIFKFLNNLPLARFRMLIDLYDLPLS